MAREVAALFKTFRQTPLMTFRALYAGCPTAAAASVSPHPPPQSPRQHGHWLRSCLYPASPLHHSPHLQDAMSRVQPAVACAACLPVHSSVSLSLAMLVMLQHPHMLCELASRTPSLHWGHTQASQA